MRKKTQLNIIIFLLVLILLVQVAYISIKLDSVEEVAKKATPAVVSIIAGLRSGSGVITSPNGYVLTNNHIIKNQTNGNITVVLSNGKIFRADIIGTDEKVDLAILKIEAKNIPYLEFGNSDKVKIGERIVAIGQPYGYDFTVTSGIVSAKHREKGPTEYRDFIQTDASINPGNSGGPLLNLKGKVIGINTFIVSDISAGELGFAIPSNLAKKIMDELIKYGNITRGYMGIAGENIINLNKEGEGEIVPGVRVTEVLTKGPATKSGIKKGDIIIEVEGKEIKNLNELRNTIAWVKPGEKTTITVLRNETKMQFTLETIERPS